jgi:hypothetical protein
MSPREQFDFLRDAIASRPERWRNFSEQLGVQNTNSAFDFQLFAQDIEDDDWRKVLCKAEYVHLEVKGQQAASNHGRVYIETWCRGKPSGISVSQAERFVLPLGGPEFQNEVVIVITRSRLEHIIAGCWEEAGGDNGVSRGKIVPIGKLVEPNRRIERVQIALC